MVEVLLYYSLLIVFITYARPMRRIPVSHGTLIDQGGPRFSTFSSLTSLSMKGNRFTFAMSIAKLRAFPSTCGGNIPLNARDR